MHNLYVELDLRKSFFSCFKKIVNLNLAIFLSFSGVLQNVGLGRATFLWPGSGSGWPFLAQVGLGPAFFGLGPVRAADFGLFLPIFDQFFS